MKLPKKTVVRAGVHQPDNCQNYLHLYKQVSQTYPISHIEKDLPDQLRNGWQEYCRKCDNLEGLLIEWLEAGVCPGVGDYIHLGRLAYKVTERTLKVDGDWKVMFFTLERVPF